MPIRSIRDVDVRGKRVFVRVDFNVPLDGSSITDDTRIRAALPTIRYLIEHGGKVILCSHLGRPKGKPVNDYRLAPVARRLEELLGRPITHVPNVVGPSVERAVGGLEQGDVLLLENVRFDPGEEANDSEFAKELATLADVFVNDAFGAAHRAHASTTGIASLLPAYAGLLIETEIEALIRLLDSPERPFVAILGGAKVSDKLGVIEHLVPLVDAVLIGGGMANTFLFGTGREIGRSLAEPELAAKARAVIEVSLKHNVQVLLPHDVVTAPDRASNDASVVNVADVDPDSAIFDIGPATRTAFAEVIKSARTIFWNGPMGMFEEDRFAEGTRAVAVAVAEANAFSVVGGGDSVAAIEQMGVADRISHISTGGGASLEFVEGRSLPGIAVLERHENP